jgi:hypothetical protein
MRKPCCCDKGACCHLDETCEITTQETCEEQCGVFQGIDVPCLQCEDNSDCFDGNCISGECDNGVDCTYERGPCCACEPEFTDCVEDLTEPECSLGESSRTCVDGELVIEYEWETGDWQGPDHTCDDECDCEDEHKGACCCGGDCSDDVSEQECVDDGCQYSGDGSQCPVFGSHPDEPVGGWGAWCYPDGPNDACCPPDQPNHPCCIDLNHPGCWCFDRCCIPVGNDGVLGACVSVCSPEHPLYPCNNYLVHNEQDCTDIAGEWMPGRNSNYGSTCNKCGQWDSESRTCICPNEDWTHDNDCGCNCSMHCCTPKGACCYGGLPSWYCQITTQWECEWGGSQLDGVFHEGVWCDEIPDPESPCYDDFGDPPQCPQTGACCVDGDNCIQNLTEEECIGAGGVFQGIGTGNCGVSCGDGGEEKVGCCLPPGVEGCEHDCPNEQMSCCASSGPQDDVYTPSECSALGGVSTPKTDGNPGGYCIHAGPEANCTGPEFNNCRCCYRYCISNPDGCGPNDSAEVCLNIESTSCQADCSEMCYQDSGIWAIPGGDPGPCQIRWKVCQLELQDDGVLHNVDATCDNAPESILPCQTTPGYCADVPCTTDCCCIIEGYCIDWPCLDNLPVTCASYGGTLSNEECANDCPPWPYSLPGQGAP